MFAPGEPVPIIYQCKCIWGGSCNPFMEKMYPPVWRRDVHPRWNYIARIGRRWRRQILPLGWQQLNIVIALGYHNYREGQVNYFRQRSHQLDTYIPRRVCGRYLSFVAEDCTHASLEVVKAKTRVDNSWECLPPGFVEVVCARLILWSIHAPHLDLVWIGNEVPRYRPGKLWTRLFAGTERRTNVKMIICSCVIDLLLNIFIRRKEKEEDKCWETNIKYWSVDSFWFHNCFFDFFLT